MEFKFHTVNLKKKFPLQISRGIHDKSQNLFVEFIKESQGGFETILPLFSTGQWLSIPLILSGLVVLIRSIYVAKN